MTVSYKPQTISPKFQGTVQQLFMARIMDATVHPQFISDVIKPLDLPRLFDREVEFILDFYVNRFLG